MQTNEDSEQQKSGGNPEIVERVLQQGKALVRAIEALDTIEKSGPIESFLAGLLMAGYKRRLRGIVASAPSWLTEEILSASEHISDQRAILWMSDN